MPTLPEIGSGLPEVMLRTAIIYLFLIAAIRLSGKREVGQMSVLELVVILIISDAVQNSMVGENTTLWGGIVAVVDPAGPRPRTQDAGRSLEAVPGRDQGRAAPAGPRRPAPRAGGQGRGARCRGGPRRGPVARLARVEDVRLAVLETDGSISVIPRDDDEPTSNRPPKDEPMR